MESDDDAARLIEEAMADVRIVACPSCKGTGKLPLNLDCEDCRTTGKTTGTVIHERD